MSGNVPTVQLQIVILHFMIKDYTLEHQIQSVLDNMLTAGETPFALNVGKVAKEDNRYIIHFYDSRLRTVSVHLNPGQWLPDLVKSAVIERVKRLSGPLAPPQVEKDSGRHETLWKDIPRAGSLAKNDS